MQAAISTVAHSLERVVRTLPISGSMAALARWNSRIEIPNTSNAGWLSKLRKPREDGSLADRGAVTRGAATLPCACSGSISCGAMRRSAHQVGMSRAAVTIKTERVSKK